MIISINAERECDVAIPILPRNDFRSMCLSNLKDPLIRSILMARGEQCLFVCSKDGVCVRISPGK